MKLQLRNMDEDTWITASGKRVKVYDMHLSHLKNVILFLRRSADEIRISILHNMWEYMQTAPDGAWDACNAETAAIIEMTPEQFLCLAVKPYKKMLERAEKEKLFAQDADTKSDSSSIN